MPAPTWSSTGAPVLEPGLGFTLEAWVWPTAPGVGRQAVCGRYDGRRGYALGLDETGAASLWLDQDTLATGEPLVSRTWYHIAATYDAQLGVDNRASSRSRSSRGRASVERREADHAVGGWSLPDAPFALAAWGDPADAHYNGKIEAPHLLAADRSVLAAWDLSGDFASAEVADTSSGGHHGRCVNLPMRSVTGRLWRGDTTDPALAPAEYAAIWFHDDDLDDARWDPSFELEIPPGLSSGVYAFRVDTGDEADVIPFFVRPPRGRATAPVVVLIPTFSYLAYANEHNSWTNPIPATPGLDEILASVGERDRYASAVQRPPSRSTRCTPMEAGSPTRLVCARS